MPALDTRLDWEAIEAVASGRVAPHPTPSRPEAPPDHLADLLDTPIHKLTAPLPVESSILGDTIFLVADDYQAATVRARGGVPYTSEEIAVLWELYRSIPPETWPARLRLIHEAKRRFGGSILPEEA